MKKVRIGLLILLILIWNVSCFQGVISLDPSEQELNEEVQPKKLTVPRLTSNGVSQSFLERENQSINEELSKNIDEGLKGFVGGFLENKGQKNDAVYYYTESAQMGVGFGASEVIFSIINPSTENLLDGEEVENNRTYTTVSLRFLGSNKVVPVAEEPTGVFSNYFLGSDDVMWVVGCQYYTKVIYYNIYDKIDLVYELNAGHLKYEFFVHPGGRVEDIKLQWNGPLTLELLDVGIQITIHQKERINDDLSSEFSFIDTTPISYQSLDREKPIEGVFDIMGPTTYGFNVPTYNPKKLLIIDPILNLSYSTYIGGSASDDGDSGNIVVDAAGNAYVAGSTYSTDFPTVNAYEADDGGYDVFVFKLNSTGNGLLYSTYVGGSEYDLGYSLALDEEGNAYVTGRTQSSDFPTVNAYDTTFNGGFLDVFVFKLAANGSSLLYSTYIGGNSDEYGYSIALDVARNAYVTGYTASTDFPTVNAYETDDGDWDVFVFKLNSTGNDLLYSTYVGGSNYDVGQNIVVDSQSNAYVTGYTFSTDFPTVNAYEVDDVDDDVFVFKLAANGSTLLYSTYVGGNSFERAHDIVLDGAGNAYVTGWTDSTNFPTVNAYETNDGGRDVFVFKLAANGSTLLYSTYVGGSNDEEPGYHGIAVDALGNIYVTGWTKSTDFPPVNAYNSTGDGSTSFFDIFVFKLNNTGNGLQYSTYVAGTNNDRGNSIYQDAAGNVYIAGYTDSTDFPTINAYNSTNNGGEDVFVFKLSFYHNPIYIDDNSDFANLGFPGDGTPSNPYRIEGFHIRNATEILIEIHDTRAHFIIQYNLLDGVDGNDDEGIYLENVTNGLIYNNIIKNSMWGIYFWEASNNSISENYVFNNSIYGLIFQGSILGAINNTVYNNTIHNNGYGIYLTGADENNITFNRVYDSTSYGIHLSSSDTNNLTYNDIYNCDNHGIYLQTSCDYNILQGNNIFNCTTGSTYPIYLDNCDHNLIVNNQIYDDYSGIHLYFSDLNNVSFNRVDNLIGTSNSIALWLRRSDNNTLSHNNLTNNNYGACYLYSSVYNTINDNLIANNSRSGIDLHWYSNGNTVINNTIYNHNLQAGIRFRDYSSSNEIINNTIYQNVYGIWLGWGGGQGGIDNNIIYNNSIFSHSQYGIILERAVGSIVVNNTISQNTLIGIYLTSGSGSNTIYFNNIQDNVGSQTNDENGTNVFYYNGWGNHWGSSYSGSDLNEDSIGETPYSFSGNQDPYPLMYPIEWYSSYNITVIDGDWTVTGLESHQNKIITLNGNLLIQSGGNLTLDDVILRFNCSFDGQYHLEVYNGGNLTIDNNSVITTSNITHAWYLKANSGSNLRLKNSTFSYAGYTWGAMGDHSGIWINTDNSEIINSEFKNGFYGLFFYNADFSNVSNCIIRDINQRSIYISSSNNNSFSGNTFSNTFLISMAIFMYGSDYNTFQANTVHEGYVQGIHIEQQCNHNNFSYNLVEKCKGSQPDGIYIGAYSDFNYLYNNTVLNNDRWGIFIDWSSNNTIDSNNISHNSGSGIVFNNANFTRIISNTIFNNSDYGIDIDSDSYSNFIEWNHLYENNLGGTQAYDAGSGNIFTFNYWDDHLGPDSEPDGIVDSPYDIAGGTNIDSYPLVYPYIPHAPIFVDENGNFSIQGFSGEGTLSNPYLIEDYFFYSSMTTLIEIRNTTAYFIIQHCVFNGINGSYNGINLSNVTHGTITNNIIHTTNGGIGLDKANNNTLVSNFIHNITNDGIYLSQSANNSITHNYIYNNSQHGIKIESSSRNNLSENIIYDNSETGIALYPDSNYTFIFNNTISNNTIEGIRLYFSYNNTLFKNTVYNNTQSKYATGISLTNSTGNTIFNNTFFNNIIGLFYMSSSNNNLSDNVFYDNKLVGVLLWNGSNNNLINTNTIYNNSAAGIELYISCSNNILFNNTIYNHNGPSWGLGIFLYSSCLNNSLTSNLIFNNSRWGIWLNGSSNSNNISENIIYNNPINGIYLMNSSKHNTIFNNTIYYSLDGIYLTSSSNNNSVILNYVFNNSQNGMNQDAGCLNNTYLNNTVIFNSKSGLKIGASKYSIISYNELYNNTEHGIYIIGSSNNTISDNIVYNNTLDGISTGSYCDNNTYSNNEIYQNGRYGINLGPYHLNTNVSFNNINNNVNHGLIMTGGVNKSVIHDNIIHHNSDGIYQGFCGYNHFFNNEIFSNTWNGISITNSVNSTVYKNTIYDNGYRGISLSISAQYNNFSFNLIFGSINYGFYIDDSESMNNTILFNVFQGNNQGNTQAYDDGINNTFRFNHWDDHISPDSDFDGYVDTPYSILGSATNQDLSPRTYPATPRSPIVIRSDADFITLGFEGSGTVLDPYLIEGLFIRNSTIHLIDIENTTVFFIIQENYLYGIDGSVNGILMFNTTNGFIFNNSISNCYYGISLTNSSKDNIILKNIISYNLWSGINFTFSCDNNTFMDNSIHHNGNYGLGGHYSNGNQIIGNEIFFNNHSGIKIHVCGDTNISYNLIHNNGIAKLSNGISLPTSFNNTVYNNTIHSNSWGGIGTDYANNTVIENNLIYNNTNRGIYFLASVFNFTVRYNFISQNQFGINIESSSNNNTIYGNSIQNHSAIGVYIDSTCSYTVVEWNSFINNNPSGSQAFDDGQNTFFAYNYWDDHTGPDANFDGIIDSPYIFTGNNDPYPLIYPYTHREPIFINNDAGFATLGFPGNGSLSNPYLIEGYWITISTATLIYIQDTTAYFIIRNNFLFSLTGISDGIYLSNVRNGTIRDNIIHGARYGIYVYSSINNTLSGNTIYNNSYHSIFLYYSSNNIISNNNVFNNSRSGINVSFSDSNVLSHNTASKNTQYGIVIFEANDNSVFNNTIYNNTLDGIVLANSTTSTTLVNNTVYNNSRYGIMLAYSSTDNNISFNDIYGNSKTGLVLWLFCSSNTLSYNYIYNNSWTGIGIVNSSNNNIISTNYIFNNSWNGIGLINSSSNNNITNNEIHHNLWNGIFMNASSSHNTLSDNTLYYNSENGILLESSAFNNTVVSNSIYNNSLDGIAIDSAHNNTLLNNVIQDQNRGISLAYSMNTTCSYNSIYNSSSDSIRLYYANYTTIIGNNVSNNVFAGMTLGFSYHNIIINNTLSNNNVIGMYIAYSSFNLVMTNLISNHLNDTWGIGIMVSASMNNTIKFNTISDNINYGIMLGPNSANNTIKRNDFLDNNPNNTMGLGPSQAYDNGTSNLFTNNFWSDWTGPDTEPDGIVDYPYIINGSAGNSDLYPLTFSAIHELSIPIVLFPNGGETLFGTISIEWTAAIDSYGYEVTYEVLFSANNGTTWVSLASGLTGLSRLWDTTSYLNSTTYLIRVIATSDGLEKEDISDGTFTIQNPPVHLPIIITSDTDFASLGFPGDGTESNPYIIEGLYIANASMFLIVIQDTTAYFIIRNNFLCGISGEFTGIYLVNVVYGTIENNHIYNCSDGIFINESEDNVVFNNEIYSNSENGIFLQASNYIDISANTIRFNGANGIFLFNSDDNTISDNIIYGNGDTGTGSGIGSTVDTASRLQASNRGNGIFLDPADDNIIFNNSIFENIENGIYLFESDYTLISSNTINDNGANGVYLNNSDDNTVSDNTIFGNGDTETGYGIGANLQFSNRGNGIFLDPADDNIISNNDIYDNLENGIYVLQSKTTQIFNNRIFGNIKNGILLVLSNLNTIFDNFISGLSSKSRTGIGASVSTTMKHEASNRGNGIFLETSSENNISSNEISNNTYYGVVIDETSEDNTVEWNDFFGNNPEGTSQAFDEGSNNEFTYNYWDDHENSDTNGDGVADSSYPIDGKVKNFDQSPMATPDGELIPRPPSPPDPLLFLLLFLLILSIGGITLSYVYRKRLKAIIQKRTRRRPVREYESLVDKAEELARTWEKDLKDDNTK